MLKKLKTLVLIVFAIPVSLILAEVGSLPSPTNFQIDLINENDVILLWDDSVDPNIEGYIISRSNVPDKKPVELARVTTSETSYIDSQVVLGSTYTYLVETYAEGFVSGQSDIKSVIVSKNDFAFLPEASDDASSDGGEANSNRDSVVNTAAELAGVGSNSFWRNLVAINLIIFGFLILLYMIVFSLFVKNDDEQLGPKQNNEAKSRAKLKLKLKSDGEHPDIAKKAKKNYYEERKQKISDWLAK